jgi:xanthine dehydrogenase accessory factor
MEIHRKIVELINAKSKFAVILVLKADGSTPLKAGAKAIVEEKGHIIGTIGGGRVEAEAQKQAVEACKSGQPIVFDFQLHGIDRNDSEPICGGAMRILVNPTAAKNNVTFNEVAEALEHHRRGVLITTIENNKIDTEWLPENKITNRKGFPDSEKILTCLKHESAELFTDDGAKQHVPTEVLIEPIIAKPRLIIAGGGHIGQALALQAGLVGFDVTVIDDRPEFTDPALYPEGTTTFCDNIPEKVADLLKDAESYVVIVTRGHKLDADVLEACIHKPVAYIGMIGSRRKVKLMRQNFIESHITTEEEFDKVFTPIGLDIGAVTVSEIAAAITAELIAVRRKGVTRNSLKETQIS